MSNTSNTRSKLTMAVMASTRALASAVSGAYSWVSSRASVTIVPGSMSPCSARYPPSPYTSARASAETSARAVMNRYWPMAVRTPISATRSARSVNSRASRSGRPNSLTRVAPGAENRSVIWPVIAALWSAASRSRWARREPMRRAGMTNIGSSSSASRVICHDRLNMTTTASSSEMALLTTPDSVQVKARWAPMTSLSSRLTSAPVRVRVKKATGIRCTWRNTARRRSRMRPSPMRADCQRSAMPTTASSRAMRAMITAIVTTRPSSWPSTISSTTRPASTGVATVRTAPTTLRARNPPNARQCGRANSAMRRRVARSKPRLVRSPCTALSSAIQWLKSICMPGSLLLQGCLRSTAFRRPRVAPGRAVRPFDASGARN